MGYIILNALGDTLTRGFNWNTRRPINVYAYVFKEEHVEFIAEICRLGKWPNEWEPMYLINAEYDSNTDTPIIISGMFPFWGE